MLVIKDFATTILASALTAAATSVVVSDASRLPALSAGDYYYLVLQKFTDRTNVEIVKVTAAAGNTLTVARAQAGTTAKAFAIGDYAEQRVTVGTFSEYITQSVATKVDEINGYVEQSLGLLNTGDLVKASVGISYDATNGHGTILSGGEGANKVTPFVALRPLGAADSSVQLKYAQDGSLILSGGSRYVETGLLSVKHAADTDGWPVNTANNVNNFCNRARQKIITGNSALFFVGDGGFNARRFGIQAGHVDAGYTTSYGILDLNPYGGAVRVNGGIVYHTGYVPTPAAVGAVSLSGGTVTGDLDQDYQTTGYGFRFTVSGALVYLQGGKRDGVSTDQQLRLSGYFGKPLTSFDIITNGDGVAKANGARIYTETYVPTPDIIGAVPQVRTINGKPLSANIVLANIDVGAVSATDNSYFRNKGAYANLNAASSARPGYFTFSPSAIGSPLSTIYGHGINIGPGADAGSSVWYSQLVFGHNGKIYTRNGINGAATGAWDYIYTSRDKPSPADIGAFPATGGTVTSYLMTSVPDAMAIRALRNGYQAMMGCSNVAGEYVFGGGADNLTDYQHYIRIGASKLQFQTADSLYNIFHEGYVPTPAVVGAVPLAGAATVTGIKIFSEQGGLTVGGGTTAAGKATIRLYNQNGTHFHIGAGLSGSSLEFSTGGIGATTVRLTMDDFGRLTFANSADGNFVTALGGYVRSNTVDILSLDGKKNVFVTSPFDAHLCYNSYWDGAGWKKYVNSRNAMYLAVGGTGLVVIGNNDNSASPSTLSLLTVSYTGELTAGYGIRSSVSGGINTYAPFFAATAGGAFASMYSRYAPFHSSFAHVGSSYGPHSSVAYMHNNGWSGLYSWGVLNYNAASAGAFSIAHVNSAGAEVYSWQFKGTNGQFISQGNISAPDFYLTSDERLKDNFEEFKDPLAMLSEIWAGLYDKKDGRYSAREAGVIAQHVRKVMPAGTHERDDGMLQVKPSSLIALLVAAVNQLRMEVRHACA